MVLRLSKRQLEFLSRMAEAAYPRESCAVLLGRDCDCVNVVVNCANVHNEPLRHYAIDPKELIRLQRVGRRFGLRITGFHHSHPDHAPEPSETDIAEANWPDCVYLMTGVRERTAGATRAFRLKQGSGGAGFEECELLIAHQ